MTKPVSAEKYMQTRARTLPIDRCLLNADWETERLAFVLIIRKHSNGNFTFAGYWVDLLCLGVRDTFYEFNVSPEDLKGYLDANREEIEMNEVDYALVHNIILAGHEFAGEYHIPQHPDFDKTTQFVLEEDSEDIPLIDIHTGDENGLPHLMVEPANLQMAVLAKLKQYAGEGHYRYTVVEDEPDEDDLEPYEPDWEDEDDDEAPEADKGDEKR